jgi:predicted O-methyltransferase YrrM
MSRKTIEITDALYDYVLALGVREHPVLRKCREETAAMGGVSVMQIAPEQGAFMAMLARLTGAKRCIEVGTFTGYSALCVALALPEDGRVDALDVSEDYMRCAHGYWEEAGQAEKITSHIGPGVATLDMFIAGGGADRYDYAFIDADKTAYDAYYERMLKLVRPGGLIAIDNVLWSGKVVDVSDRTGDTLALRALNEKIRDDGRVDIALAPIADGLFLCRKR